MVFLPAWHLRRYGFLHVPGPKLGLFGTATARALGQVEVSTASFAVTSTYSVPSPILSIQTVVKTPSALLLPRDLGDKLCLGSKWCTVPQALSPQTWYPAASPCPGPSEVVCPSVPQEASSHSLKSDVSLCCTHLQCLLSQDETSSNLAKSKQDYSNEMLTLERSDSIWNPAPNMLAPLQGLFCVSSTQHSWQGDFIAVRAGFRCLQ